MTHCHTQMETVREKQKGDEKRDLRCKREANRVSEGEKTELQIKLRGWSSSMLEAFLM